jgi:4-hydroxy-tetrahydrodipicolinate synthase
VGLIVQLKQETAMTLLNESATGVYAIAVTPFSEDGVLDLASAATMVDFYIGAGVAGITILGVLGEAPKLTATESRQFMTAVVDAAAGRVPIVVGVSSPGFAAMAELAQASMAAGAAGVMVAPPPALRTDDQIVGYFQQVAATLGDIPFVLQDHPQSTGVTMSLNVILRIIDTVPTCVMLKFEEPSALAKLTALRAASDSGKVRRISILGGNGAMFLPEELQRGSDGAMTGFAYPEMMVDMCRASAAGNQQQVRDLHDAYLPLARYEQQVGIGLAVRKYILAQRGAIACGALRAPGPKMTALDLAEVTDMIERQQRRLKEIA